MKTIADFLKIAIFSYGTTFTGLVMIVLAEEMIYEGRC